MFSSMSFQECIVPFPLTLVKKEAKSSKERAKIIIIIIKTFLQNETKVKFKSKHMIFF